MGTVLSALTGWALFVCLTGLVGALAGRWVLLRTPGLADTRGGALALRSLAARFGAVSALGLGVALILVFARQLVEFHDPFAPWIDDARVLLFDTGWGTTWLVAVPLAFVAWLSFRRAVNGSRWAWGLATTAALVLGLFPALTGHANGGDLRPLTVTADTLHVWAAGAWIGGLALMLILEQAHRKRGAPGEGSLLPSLVPRFSPLAMGCVATLVVTGTLAAWLHLESLQDLVTTGYGRTLLTKLALVAVVLALGALNWRRLTPRLVDHDGPAALHRAATVEFLIANAVLLVTALLVRTSPG